MTSMHMQTNLIKQITINTHNSAINPQNNKRTDQKLHYQSFSYTDKPPQPKHNIKRICMTTLIGFILIFCSIFFIKLLEIHSTLQKLSHSKFPHETNPPNIRSLINIQPKLNEIKNQDLTLSQHDHPQKSNHNHGRSLLPYPTLGMPHLNIPFNQQPILFDSYLSYELKQDQLFKPHGNTDCQFERYGAQPDNGHVLCKNLMNQSQALLNFGMKGGDNFGCSVSTAFTIKNYLYDNSCQSPIECNNQGRTQFKRIFLSEISEVNKENSFTSLKDEIDKNHLVKKHIILKLNVEGAEWMALKTLPLQYLQYIDQMVIKFHNPRHPQIVSPLQGYQTIIEQLKTTFASVNIHMDNHQCVSDYQYSKFFRKYRSTSFEVTLVNKKLLKIKDQSRLYFTNFKNVKNSIFKPDCQMNDND